MRAQVRKAELQVLPPVCELSAFAFVLDYWFADGRLSGGKDSSTADGSYTGQIAGTHSASRAASWSRGESCRWRWAENRSKTS